jgi:hypothetical protein
MNIELPDIDVDVADRNRVLELFKHVPAAIQRGNNRVKHNTGVYFHEVPVDPYSRTCTVDYKRAEDIGFFKIDVLNVGIYSGVRDEQHLLDLMNREPIWELLEHREFCDNLFHLSGNHKVCKTMKPDSVEKLAAVLAMIRPAKRYLIGENWNKVFAEVWQPPKDGEYFFKKAHGISYAVAVVVHMNLLCEQFA